MKRHAPYSNLAQTPADIVKEMSRWYLLSRAIHTIAELGIANYVGKTPISATEVAQLSHTKPELLERLLRFLSGYGIFIETNPGLFSATELSDTLRDDHPQSVRPTLSIVDNAWWNTIGNLSHTVKTGETAFDFTNNMKFFEYLAHHPEQQKRYDAGMACNSKKSDASIAQSYNFSQFKHIIDIGGGRGGLLAEILKKYPSVSATLFDQPQVIKDLSCLKNEHLLNRCTLVGGNFFTSTFPSADAYLIKGVLHDFNDEDCLKILSQCRQAMSPYSKLLVIERPIPAGNHPHPNKMMDILMMALLNGKERTLAAWQTLFEKVKLKLNQVVQTSSDFTIIEGTTIS